METPRTYARYWDKKSALDNKAFYESRGFKMLLQERKGSKWVGVDVNQTTFDE